jgi:hypothetical protein
MAYGQNMNAPMSGLMGLAAMKGRMGDNTLVHVNPMELKALNAMAGPGGLTQNPTTGLPEAFKIKDLLPVLGAVAMPFAAPAIFAGTGLAGLAGNAALMSGIGGAAGTALAGGNKKEILTSGITSGVTAGLTGGFGSSADKIAAASEAVGKTGYEAGKLASSGLAKGLGQSIADTTKQSIASNVAGELGAQALKSGAATGLAAAATSPAMFDVPAGPKGVAPPTTVPTTQMTQTASTEDIDRFIRQGGATPQFFNYSPVQIPAQFGGMTKKEGGSMGDGPATYIAQGGDTSESGMFSGMVEAPEGDGMSDNVSFEVVGDPEIKQAMLSPDEYVMDAFTVAALGNGSSDAGAKKLDNFRLALREKVYGKEAQPKQVDGAKELSRLA